MPRLLAIGDIHGCLNALQALVKAAQIQADDVLVTLGDYVDRGPDSKGVIDWLINRLHAGKLIPLRGNHDVMMSESRFDNAMRDAWYSFGGIQTLQSYGQEGVIGTLDDVPRQHWSFLDDECCRYFETDRHVFVHGMLDPNLPLEQQPDTILYWEKFRNLGPHCSGKVMICGHTAQKTGLPLNLGHAICIDTWIYGSGWLTCLDVATGEYWQARESGETRQNSL